MLVRQSTFDEMESKYRATYAAYSRLNDRWNALVARINKRGGEEFLNAPDHVAPLSAGDVQRLIQLCHPDKHDSKPMAVEMTKKLLALKADLEAKTS